MAKLGKIQQSRTAYLALLSTGILVNAGVIAPRELTTPEVAGWTSKGCWIDSLNGVRTLQGGYRASGDNTIESCLKFCSDGKYKYGGVEYGGECFCSLRIYGDATQQADADCNMACPGDNAQPCGGNNRLTLYESTASGATIAGGSSGYHYLGCFTDNPGARTLNVPMTIDGGVTAANCLAACSKNNYLYAGVEYSSECYCGNNLLNGGGLASDGEKQCDMLCAGDSKFICGGPNRLNIYTLDNPPLATSSSSAALASETMPPNWAADGCYTDSVAARTLRYWLPVPGGSDQMTVDACVTACNAKGYKVAGLEYSQECWCDFEYQASGVSVTDGCTMDCKGNATEKCGGSDRMNVYTSVISTIVSSSTSSSDASATMMSSSFATDLSTITASSTFSTDTSTTTESSSTSTSTATESSSFIAESSSTTASSTFSIDATIETSSSTISTLITSASASPSPIDTVKEAPTCATKAVGPNLLQNPGFESGQFAPWNIWQSQGWGTATQGVSGSGAGANVWFRVDNSRDGGGASGYMSQTVSVEAGKEYDIQFSVSHEAVFYKGSCSLNFNVGQNGIGSTSAYGASTISPSNGWLRESKSFIATGSSVTLQLSYQCLGTGYGLTRVDDFVLRESNGCGNKLFNTKLDDSSTDPWPWYFSSLSTSTGGLTVDTSGVISGANSAKLTHTSATPNKYVYAAQNVTGLATGSYTAGVFVTGRVDSSVTSAQCSVYVGYVLNGIARTLGTPVTFSKTGLAKKLVTGNIQVQSGSAIVLVALTCMGTAGQRWIYMDDAYMLAPVVETRL
ncbi:WSC domain-containing protein [Colletotrichum truncatum]|uniref:WSC domain-containing protein n=1 Tax=Colletotrichum truncatum TaxID=5467 RepID=A0ACC3ZH28_COLTU|nr:WSC domain-containing protein [Colletotrichum truncatum]KAF6784631.1 WSC domain-containing protein [Colletotrichum truncatum]